MTKMIKMSLIAAVAVTGMTSVASAQPLEEAIKGVDVSGMMRYRYDETSTDTKAAAATTNKHDAVDAYRLDVNLKSKVNDIVTANVTAGISGNTGNDVALDTSANDGAAAVSVRNANFTFALPVATVIAGKQSIPGPFVDNTVDDVSRGTGVVALIPAGPVTIAAGHFNNHTVTSTNAAVAAYLAPQNATELAVIGSASGVSFDVWYANVTDTLDAMTFGLKTAVAGINLDARYSTLDMEDAYRKSGLSATADGKSSLTKLVASTKIGSATVVAGLALTGEANGAGVANHNRIAIDNDNDAAVDFKVWQASAGSFADATAFLVAASMEVMPAVTADVKYVTLGAKESDAAAAKDVDASELYFGATYAMSKNFSVHARYSFLEVDRDAASLVNANDTEATKGRLEIKYTF